jgi:two-component system, chemotaxis family, CheB/CheR fusion protein
MYFNSSAQARILSSLQFSLRPRGFLVLGNSEALTTRSHQFTPVDLKCRIFHRTPTRREGHMPDDPRPASPVQSAVDPPPANLRNLSFEVGTSAQIVLDVGGRVVSANHNARSLFRLSVRDVGRQVQDLELSYRPLELRSRLDAIYAERRPMAVRDVEWRRGDDTMWFDVLLHPIVNPAGALQGTSVAFVDVSPQHRMQDELQRARTELESAYQELQSAVEELETTNEELQSTNEELETTNEELQSTNEELETTNDELRLRSVELDEINNTLESILTSLRSAVVVVDRDMRIQVWNRPAQELWGLRADEVEGEHLMNLDIGLPVERLRQSIRACFAGGQVDPVAMPAVNRRGRAIDCVVRVTSLIGRDEQVTGAILLMDPDDGTTGPDVAPPDAVLLGDQPSESTSSQAGRGDAPTDDGTR